MEEESPFEDLEGEGSGLAFYWENPWEIKASIVRGFWAGFRMISENFSQSDSPGPPIPDRWEIISISIDGRPVVGPATSHPDSAAALFQWDKSEASLNRARYALSLLGASAVWILSKRVYTNWRVRPSFLFARGFLEGSPVVGRFYEGGIRVISRTGEFAPGKIDGEITVTGVRAAASGGESTIQFKAHRGTDGQWFVTKADLVPGNDKRRIISLLV